MKQSRRLFEAATLMQAEPMEGFTYLRIAAFLGPKMWTPWAPSALHEASNHPALIEVLNELTLLLPERRGRTAELLLRLLKTQGPNRKDCRGQATLSDGIKLEPVEVSSKEAG